MVARGGEIIFVGLAYEIERIVLCRYVTGFVYLTGVNLALTMVAASLCVVFAPTAAGPGIPEIKAYLNGVDTPNMFGASTLFVKVRQRAKIVC